MCFENSLLKTEDQAATADIEGAKRRPLQQNGRSKLLPLQRRGLRLHGLP
jgi:hypothetical protein